MRRNLFFILSMVVLLAANCTGKGADIKANPASSLSIRLLPKSPAFDLEAVPQGAVSFTASIKNAGTETITVAHPSLCFPADYTLGDIRSFEDSHGKSEILLKITRPNGSELVLRDGSLYAFDPGNIPLLTIPPGESRTFEVGWFFQNARGRWEQDDQAAKAFLMKGEYRVRILLRNAFPKAALYDENAGGTQWIDVWTGEMESPEISIRVN